MRMEFYETELGTFCMTIHDNGEVEIRPVVDLRTFSGYFLPEAFDPIETIEWSDAFFLHEMRIKPL